MRSIDSISNSNPSFIKGQLDIQRNDTNVKTDSVQEQENKKEKLPSNELKHLLDGSTYLQFSVHQETKDIIVKVLDTSTKEILREIPSERILDIVSKVVNHKGIFLDQKL